MAFILSIKDTYRQAVEAATGGKNTVMYDAQGNPSVMVRIPKFNLSDVITGAPATPHPAFIVNGVVKSEIWVSKYLNVVQNGLAYSLPGQDPAAYQTFDQAKAACVGKGAGWHLMTNAEWAAIALWCKKNNSQPRGNNNFGSDISASYETAKETYHDAGQNKTGRTATGSGPASWYHDGTPAGIADLNGNVSEWVDGLRLVNGKIYVHQDNNFGTPDDLAQFVDTATYLDSVAAGSSGTTDSNLGNFQFSDSRANPAYTGGDNDNYYSHNEMAFESSAAKSGFTVPDLLKYLAIAPAETGYNGDWYYVRNYGNRFAIRSGGWGNGTPAGVFYLALNFPRSNSYNFIGFRAAFAQ